MLTIEKALYINLEQELYQCSYMMTSQYQNFREFLKLNIFQFGCDMKYDKLQYSKTYYLSHCLGHGKIWKKINSKKKKSQQVFIYIFIYFFFIFALLKIMLSIKRDTVYYFMILIEMCFFFFIVKMARDFRLIYCVIKNFVYTLITNVINGQIEIQEVRLLKTRLLCYVFFC